MTNQIVMVHTFLGNIDDILDFYVFLPCLLFSHVVLPTVIVVDSFYQALSASSLDEQFNTFMFHSPSLLYFELRCRNEIDTKPMASFMCGYFCIVTSFAVCRFFFLFSCLFDKALNLFLSNLK